MDLINRDQGRKGEIFKGRREHDGGGLRRVFSSPIITLNFQLGMRVTLLVTSLGWFGRAKMAADLGLNQPTSLTVCERKAYSVSK